MIRWEFVFESVYVCFTLNECNRPPPQNTIVSLLSLRVLKPCHGKRSYNLYFGPRWRFPASGIVLENRAENCSALRYRGVYRVNCVGIIRDGKLQRCRPQRVVLTKLDDYQRS